MKKISENKRQELLSNISNLMLNNEGRLYWLKDCKIESKTETPAPTFWNRKPKPVENLYLVDISLYSYNHLGHFLGKYDYESACEIISSYDLYAMRNEWLEFKEQLKSFGLEVIHRDDLKRVENQEVRTN